MNNQFKIIASLLLLFALLVSCNQGKQQSPINPNGDSELALLMREMYDEAERIKQQIENGEPVEINLDHESILTAHATEPDKVASEQYKAFAKSYIQSIKNLESAEPEQLVSLYDHVVNNCMVCHRALCPGPVVRIKKLQ